MEVLYILFYLAAILIYGDSSLYVIARKQSVKPEFKCFVPKEDFPVLVNSLTNATLTPGDYIESTTFVEYRCPKGFSLVGEYSINYCNEGWRYPHPKCIKMCPPIKEITVDARCYYKGNKVNCSKHSMPGTTANISCAFMYQKIQDRENYEYLHCNDNGDWNHSILECEEICDAARVEVPSSVGSNKTEVNQIPWQLKNDKLNLLQTNHLDDVNRRKRETPKKIVINDMSDAVRSRGVVLNNKLYFTAFDGNIYEYDPQTSEQKIIIKIGSGVWSGGVAVNNNIYIASADEYKVYEVNPKAHSKRIVISMTNYSESNGIALNNKVYFGSHDGNVYEYDTISEIEKVVIKTKGIIRYQSGLIYNNKIYFGSNDKNVYEYDPETGQQRIIISNISNTTDGCHCSGVAFKRKLYFSSFDGYIYEYNTETNQHKIITKIEWGVWSGGVAVHNKLYFASSDAYKVFEINPQTYSHKAVMHLGGYCESNGIALNDRVYFASQDRKVYEYDTVSGYQKVVIEAKGAFYYQSGLVFNNRIYFGSEDKNVYEYFPEYFSAKDVVDNNSTLIIKNLEEKLKEFEALFKKEKMKDE